MNSAIVWTLKELKLSRSFYAREGGVLVKTGIWAFEGCSFSGSGLWGGL